MTKLYIFIFLVLCSLTVFSQSNTKIDFRLNEIINKRTILTESNPNKIFTSEQNDVTLYQVIIYSDNNSELIKTGLNINSTIPGYATARLTTDEIYRAADLNYVKYISLPEILSLDNDIASSLSGANLLHSGYVNGTAYTGQSVLLCIIDTGIDWKHPDFRGEDDQTLSRIVYIWDQTATDDVMTQTPAERHAGGFSSLTYGVEYSKMQIEDELDGTPAGFVLEADINGHGTHVAGIAAGNGKALTNLKYKGIAPQADILFVKAGDGSFSSSNIIDALSYAGLLADELNKPLVVNMSLGGHSNAHDGTSAQDIAVNTLSGNKKVVVVSAGNDGSTNIHFTGNVTPLTFSTINFTIGSYTPKSGQGNDYAGFDIWLNNSADVNVEITSPNNYTALQNNNSSGTTQTNDGSIYINNNDDPNNNDRRVYITIVDNDAAYPPAIGTWAIKITNNTANPYSYHGWLFVKSMSVTGFNGNSTYTVGSPGVASDAITVGSYAYKWSWMSSNNSFWYGGTSYGIDKISSFSSIGPRRDEVQKPDITALGQYIISTTSSNYTPSTDAIVVNGLYHKNQGTSMSAPVVTGSAALLFQQNSNYTDVEIKSLLTSYANTDAETGIVPNYTWGYGKLNIFKSLIKGVNISYPSFFDLLKYDTWTNDTYVSVGNTQKMAVKITPANSGTLSGITFCTAQSPINFTGNLYAELWSDNAGLPGSKLGSTVLMASTGVSPYSWNYINMESANVNVTSGNNYHILLYFTEGNNTYFKANNTGSYLRSSFFSGGSWSQVTYDWRIQGIVTPSNSALPIELVLFTGYAKENLVELNWVTASEINNYGFDIEKAVISDEILGMSFKKIGFIEGYGNSNSTKEYSFIENSVDVGKYLYRLKQIDKDGLFKYSDAVEINVSSAPKDFAVLQNYPNPFNPSTTINFSLPQKEFVTLKIFDVLGNEVANLVNEELQAGSYNKEWNPTGLASGIYFYRLQTGQFSKTRKMNYLK
ncbi:MAG: S8 family serine peptidase [bacterium]